MPSTKTRLAKAANPGKQQFSVWATEETLKSIDKLINYKDIKNRSDAVAFAARIAAERLQLERELIGDPKA
jgi:metal-responsive CopG/Arc/MetJ family transcriptional regulator